MVTRPLLIVALFTYALLPSTGACQKKPRSLVPKAKRPKYAPAPLQARRKHAAAIYTAKVRVLGDHEFRAQQLDWRREVRVLIDNANQMLVPEFGLQLEVVDWQEWTRQASGSDLNAMLSELEDRESGADVDWVIGMVSALSEVTSDISALGIARPLGKHLIMRGYNDVAEHKRLGDKINKDIARARKQHKQVAVLLHEIGHTLGSLHANGIRAAIMNASYSDKMSEFAPANIVIIKRLLEERMQRPADPAREAQALRAILEGQERWHGWAPTEHEAMLKTVRSFAGPVASADQDGDTEERAQGDRQRIPPQAGVLYRRVGQLLRAGDMDTAWAELQSLMQSYPAYAEFRMTACHLWMQRAPLGEEAVLHCKRVGELDPSNSAGEMVLIGAYIKDKKLPEAHKLLIGVLSRVGKLDNEPQNNTRQALWESAVAVYRALSAVTWAEQAIATAPPDIDTKELRAWTKTTRRRYGLPAKSARHGITPELEGEYILQVRAVLQLTYAKDYNKARKLARTGLGRFKNGPGFLGALCDLEYRARNYPAAHGRCASALRYFPDGSWSRYLMGILELRKKRNAVGIKHLKRAIADDPDLKQAYHALYQAYARTRDKLAMAELRSTYFERFRAPLPTR